MQNEQNARAYLTPVEAAERFGVHPSTVRRHVGRLGSKVLGRYRLDPAKVEAAASGRTTVGGDAA